MSNEIWGMHFKQFRTRTEVRNTLTSTLLTLQKHGISQTVFPMELNALATSNDREVVESYALVKTFCDGKKGNERRSIAAAIGADVRDLFAVALDRMKELPPEPIKVGAVVSASPLVRRA